MSDEIDDRIGQILDELQPRLRQRSGYKSDHILRNYDKLLRAKNELGWSYKDLADLLTKEGRPTRVPTLKYNMRRIAAQRKGEVPGKKSTTNGQLKRQNQGTSSRITTSETGQVKDEAGSQAASDTAVSGEAKPVNGEQKVRRLAVAGTTETTPKQSTGTIQRFTR